MNIIRNNKLIKKNNMWAFIVFRNVCGFFWHFYLRLLVLLSHGLSFKIHWAWRLSMNPCGFMGNAVLHIPHSPSVRHGLLILLVSSHPAEVSEFWFFFWGECHSVVKFLLSFLQFLSCTCTLTKIKIGESLKILG